MSDSCQFKLIELRSRVLLGTITYKNILSFYLLLCYGKCLVVGYSTRWCLRAVTYSNIYKIAPFNDTNISSFIHFGKLWYVCLLNISRKNHLYCFVLF